MTNDTPTVDTSWELKWRRSLRNGKPTQELGYELAKAKECFVYWNSDVALWEKHKMVIPTKPMGESDEV